MDNFWKCFWYLILTGIIAFFVGRILPKKWFRPDLFPYRCYSFEKGGKIYDKLKIHRWQNKLPDMSKIFPQMMPPKNLSGNYKDRIPCMLQETCIAELIHTLLCVTGLHCLRLYPGIGGVIIVILYIVVFNLPYILIQRYNRPRLLKIIQRMQRTEKARETANERSAGVTCVC